MCHPVGYQPLRCCQLACAAGDAIVGHASAALEEGLDVWAALVQRSRPFGVDLYDLAEEDTIAREELA